MAQDKLQIEMKDMDKPLPAWFMVFLPFYMVGILSVCLFPIARDWRWLEAWVFIITFSVNMTIGYSLINKNNPRVLRNRMKMKKQGVTEVTRKSAGSDRWLMPLMIVGFFGALLLPAFAHRYGWSSLPFGLEMVGVALMNVGLVIMNISMMQNPHASKILDINQDQILIDSGPYSHVRHPLYSGGILMIAAVPIALGSWPALIPAVVAALTLVMRIKFEEEMLVLGMEGYQEYRERVKYKLMPKIY